MAKPHFNAALVGDLRGRVIAHNQANPGAETKLQELKKVYSGGYRGLAPGAAAMAAVERHLDGRALAKAGADPEFDEAKHRRDRDGKFAPKGGGGSAAPRQFSATLPKSRDEHEEAMRDNAGYAALQTAVIPERRYEMAGIAAREGLAAAAGVGLTVHLAGRRKGKAASRLAGWFVGDLASLGTSIAAAEGTRVGDAVSRGVGRMRGTETWASEAVRAANRRRRIKAATDWGYQAGHKVGSTAVDWTGAGVRRVVDAVEASGATPTSRAIRRWAAITKIGLIPAIAIRQSVIGTWMDPQVAGQAVDTLTTRRVEKILSDGGMAKAHDVMNRFLGQDGAGGALAKVSPGLVRMYETAGRAVLTGAAGAAGAGAGAAIGYGGAKAYEAAAGKRRGNPYRDEDGQFTSKENARTTLWAVGGGAALGAVAAGVVTAVALKRHNARLITEAVEMTNAAYRGRIDRVDAAAGFRGVARTIKNRQTIVDDAVRNSKEVAAAEADIVRYGARSPMHYKLKIEQEVNDKIGELAVTGWDDFIIPGAKSIGQQKSEMAFTAMRRKKMAGEVSAFAARATEGEFTDAIKGLSTEQKKTALHFFNNRSSWMGGVDQVLRGHTDAVKGAETAAKAARAAMTTAQTREADAVAKFNRTKGPGLADAEDAVNLARQETQAATEAWRGADQAHGALKVAGPDVVSPVSGMAIPSATPLELGAPAAAAAARARKAAEVAVDKQIAAGRVAQRVNAAEATNRRIAAVATLTERRGLSGSAETKRRFLAANSRALEAQEAAVGEARKAVDAMETAAAAQKAIKFKGPARVAAEEARALATKAQIVVVGDAQKAVKAAEDAAAALALRQAATPASEAVANAVNAQKVVVDNARKAARAAAADLAAIKGRPILSPGQSAANEALDQARANLQAETAKLETGRKVQARLADEFQASVLGTSKQTGYNVLPPDLAAGLRRDLGRAMDGMSDTAREFIANPTMQTMIDWGRWGAEGVKEAGLATGRKLFFKPDGKGGWTPSLPKIMISGPTLLSTPTAVKATWDSYFGDSAERAAARPEKQIDRHYKIDPITGASYVVVSAPHPTEKGERVVLYGERQDSFDAPSKPIYAGGKVSDIDKAWRDGKLVNNKNNDERGDNNNNNNQTHTGDLANLSQSVKDKVKEAMVKIRQDQAILNEEVSGAGGVRVAYLKASADAHGAAGGVIDHMRNQYLNPGKGGSDGEGYFNALKSLFSKEAQVLTARQRFKMLTNRDENGAKWKYDHGIFANSGDFSSTDRDKITSALSAEMDRAMKLSPTQEQIANLHRAVHIVKVDKGLSDDAVRPIHTKLSSLGKSQPSPGANKAASTPQQAGPSLKSILTMPSRLPKDWDEDDLNNLAESSATKLRQSLGFSSTYEVDYQSAIREMSIAVNRVHKLPMRDALDATRQAITQYAGASREMRDSVSSEVRNERAQQNDELLDLLDAEARKYRPMAQALALDDLDVLMKAFGESGRPWDETKYRRQGKGSDRGGEFTSKGGAVAASSAGTGAPAPQRQPRERMGDLHPVKVSGEIGGLAVAQAAWLAAKHFMPKVDGNARAATARAQMLWRQAGGNQSTRAVAMNLAQRFLPAPLNVARLGVQVAASAAGQAAGAFAGDQAARAAYRVAGKPVPRDAAPGPFGRDLADTAGQLVGGIAGSVAGGFAGGVGGFAGGVGGSWAGGVAARQMHDWFTGYDPNKVDRAKRRFMGGGERARA